jgi:hypothetical protein
MTPREGFKFGFLLRCAEEGLSVDEAQARAARGLEKQAFGLSDLVKLPEAIGSLGGKVVLAGGLASALGGGLAGHALAKMQDDEADPAEIRRQELIDAYTTQAELAKRKAVMAAMHNAQPRPRSRHGI